MSVGSSDPQLAAYENYLLSLKARVQAERESRSSSLRSASVDSESRLYSHHEALANPRPNTGTNDPNSHFLAEKKALLELIERSTVEAERLRQSNSELERQKKQAREELVKLQSKTDDEPRQSEKLLGKYESLVAEVEALGLKIVQLQTEKQEREIHHAADIRSLKAQRDQLHKEAESRRSQVVALESTLKSTEKALESEKKHLSMQREEQNMLILERDELHHTVDGLQQRVARLEESQKILKEDIDKRDELLNFQEVTINDLDARVGKTTELAKDWERKYNELRSSSANNQTIAFEYSYLAAAAYGDTLRSLASLLQVDPNPLAEREGDHETGPKTVDKLRAAIRSAEAFQAKLNANPQGLQPGDLPDVLLSEKDLLPLIASEVDSRLAQSRLVDLQRATVDELSSQAEELTTELGACRIQRDEAESQLETLTAELLQSKTVADSLRRQLNESIADYPADQLDSLSRRLTSLEEQLRESELDRRRAQSKNAELQAQTESLQSEIRLKDAEQKALIERSSATQPGDQESPRRSAVALREECERLREQVRQLKLDRLRDMSDVAVDVTPSRGGMDPLRVTPRSPQGMDESSILEVKELDEPLSASPNRDRSPKRKPFFGESTSAALKEAQDQLKALQGELKKLRLERDIATERCSTQVKTIQEEKETTISALKRQLFLLQKEMRAREAKSEMILKELEESRRANAQLEVTVKEYQDVLNFVSSQRSSDNPKRH